MPNGFHLRPKAKRLLVPSQTNTSMSGGGVVVLSISARAMSISGGALSISARAASISGGALSISACAVSISGGALSYVDLSARAETGGRSLEVRSGFHGHS